MFCFYIENLLDENNKNKLFSHWEKLFFVLLRAFFLIVCRFWVRKTSKRKKTLLVQDIIIVWTYKAHCLGLHAVGNVENYADSFSVWFTKLERGQCDFWCCVNLNNENTRNFSTRSFDLYVILIFASCWILIVLKKKGNEIEKKAWACDDFDVPKCNFEEHLKHISNVSFSKISSRT